MTNPELFLPAISICNIKFTNDNEAVKNFDAVQNGFDFSLLGNHGQMSVDQTDQPTNTLVIPGLTSFVKPHEVTPQSINNMVQMIDKRWGMLSKHAVNALQG